MARSIFTHLLRTLVPAEELKGCCAVVIDVLRATTTIVHALEAGAKTIVPCPSIDFAWEQAKDLGREKVLLGGERGGVPIDGFDIGNSPTSYTPKRLAGKTLILTTTNGTKALQTATHAESVYTAAFANLSAVVKVLGAEDKDIHLICSGTDERITEEDCLCAGAIISELLKQPGEWDIRTDQTQLALALYEKKGTSQEALCDAIHKSRGGVNLHRTNQQSDIDQAAIWDTSSIVPVWNQKKNRIEIKKS